MLLGAHRVLDYLYDDALSFEQYAFDRAYRFAWLARFPDVGDVQEGGAVEADVDERRLHAGQDADDAPDIDIANQSTT